MRSPAVKVFVFATFTILALSFASGCVPSENMRGDEGDVVKPAESVEILGAGVSETSLEVLVEAMPDRIVAALGNIAIDADVKLPVLSSETHRVLAQKKQWGDEELGMFFGNSEWTLEAEEGDYRYYTSGDKSLSTSAGMVRYGGMEAHYYDIPTMYCTTQVEFDKAFPATDLEGLTVEEAIEASRNLIIDLGLEPYECVTANTLDMDSLNHMQEINVMDSDDFFKIDEEDIARVYETSDEVIVLSWQLALYGLPLSRSSFSDEASERYIGGCSAEIWMGRNGPVNVSIHGAVVVDELRESFSDIVSLEQALAQEVQKFSQVVSDKSIDVTEIRLEYMAFPTDKNELKETYDLAWAMSPGDLDQEKYKPLLVVNAFDGAVI